MSLWLLIPFIAAITICTEFLIQDCLCFLLQFGVYNEPSQFFESISMSQMLEDTKSRSQPLTIRSLKCLSSGGSLNHSLSLTKWIWSVSQLLTLLYRDNPVTRHNACMWSGLFVSSCFPQLLPGKEKQEQSANQQRKAATHLFGEDMILAKLFQVLLWTWQGEKWEGEESRPSPRALQQLNQTTWRGTWLAAGPWTSTPCPARSAARCSTAASSQPWWGSRTGAPTRRNSRGALGPGAPRTGTALRSRGPLDGNAVERQMLATWLCIGSRFAPQCAGCSQNRCCQGRLFRWRRYPPRVGTWLPGSPGGPIPPSSWTGGSCNKLDLL